MTSNPEIRSRTFTLACAACMLSMWISPSYSESPSLFGFTLEPFTPTIKKDQSWKVYSLIEGSGLEKKYIFTLDFEKNGTMWFAASDGLYRYDGFTWTQYTDNDNLPSRMVRCVFVDHQDRLWVGTDRGAGVFHEGSFQSFDSEKHLAGPNVRRIRQDRDGRMWFCCDKWPKANVSSGLSSFFNGEWKSYTVKDGLPDDHVIDFYEDSTGRKYVLTQKGLACWNGQRWIRPSTEEGLPNTDQCCWSIVETGEGSLLVSMEPFYYFHLEDNRWTSYGEYPLQGKDYVRTKDGAILSCGFPDWNQVAFYQWDDGTFEIASASIKVSRRRGFSDIKEGPDGKIWCVGEDFLAVWEREAAEWNEYGNLPMPVVEDNEGRIWFIDSNRAVVLIEDQWYQIRDFNVLVISNLNSYRIQSSEDYDGILLLGKAGSIQYYSKEEFISHTGIHDLKTYTADSSNHPWFYGLDYQENSIVSYWTGEEWKRQYVPEINSGDMISAAADHLSGVWYLYSPNIFHGLQLIWIHDGEANEIKFNPPLGATGHFHVYVDKEGILWIYGEGIGLNRLDRNTKNWSREKDIVGNTVYTFLEKWGLLCAIFKDINLGISGIAIHNKTQWFLQYYDQLAEQIHYHLEYGQNLLLVTETNHLYWAVPEHDYVPSRVSMPMEGWTSSGFVDSQKRIWGLIGDSGYHNSIKKRVNAVFSFRPDRIPPDTRIDCSNQNPAVGDCLEARFRGYEKFRPLNILKHYSYSYRIDSATWTGFDSGSSLSIDTSNMDIGVHTLKVCARDEGLDIDSTPAVLQFTVEPLPLQKRTWFIPLSIIVILLLLFSSAAAAIKSRQLNAYAGRLEQLVEKRTSELRETEINLLQISEREQQRIGHDLHDGVLQDLTAVALSGELIIKDLSRESKKRSEEVKGLVDMIDHIALQTRKLSRGLAPVNVDETGLIGALDELCANAEKMTGIECSFSWDEFILLQDENARINLYRIVQEAINNAIKHARPSRITVFLYEENDFYELYIKDNGIGFETGNKTSPGMGMKIMKYRANTIHASLSIESTVGKGTIVSCRLPRNEITA